MMSLVLLMMIWCIFLYNVFGFLKCLVSFCLMECGLPKICLYLCFFMCCCVSGRSLIVHPFLSDVANGDNDCGPMYFPFSLSNLLEVFLCPCTSWSVFLCSCMLVLNQSPEYIVFYLKDRCFFELHAMVPFTHMMLYLVSLCR